MLAMELEENEAQVQAYEKLYKAGQYAQLLRDTDPPQTPEQCYFRGLGYQEIKQFEIDWKAKVGHRSFAHRSQQGDRRSTDSQTALMLVRWG